MTMRLIQASVCLLYAHGQHLSTKENTHLTIYRYLVKPY